MKHHGAADHAKRSQRLNGSLKLDFYLDRPFPAQGQGKIVDEKEHSIGSHTWKRGGREWVLSFPTFYRTYR